MKIGARRMSQGRTRARQLLKFVLGGAVLFWMVHSDKLNVRQVVDSLARWRTLMAILFLLYLQRAVIAWRWNLLLRAQEIRIPYRRAFGLDDDRLSVQSCDSGSGGRRRR